MQLARRPKARTSHLWRRPGEQVTGPGGDVVPEPRSSSTPKPEAYAGVRLNESMKVGVEFAIPDVGKKDRAAIRDAVLQHQEFTVGPWGPGGCSRTPAGYHDFTRDERVAGPNGAFDDANRFTLPPNVAVS